MVFKIKYEWKIQDFSGFPKTEDFVICSPVFIASPDEILHLWKGRLQWKSNEPDYYGVYLSLEDEPFEHPISVKFHLKVFDKENKLVTERECDKFLEYASEANLTWGVRKAIDCYKCHIKTINKICLDIELIREQPSKSINSELNVHKSTSKVLEHLSSLYDSKSYTDTTIICQDQEFQVHKAILVSRSKVFKTMFENKMEESNSGKINIADVAPDALKEFLKFLYTGSLNAIY